MVATPDFSHAAITMAAIKKGKHVYCEKPLTYSVYEARQVTEAARKAKVATQLGNQGQAETTARIIQEYILDDAIGPVHEVWVPWGIGAKQPFQRLLRMEKRVQRGHGNGPGPVTATRPRRVPGAIVSLP